MDTRNRPVLTPSFALIACMQASFGFSWSTFLLLPKYATVELGASSAQVGWLSAVSGGVAVLAVPWTGRVIDSLGRKPVIIAGCLSATAYAFAFTRVDAIDAYLYALQALNGLCFVFTFNAAGALVTDAAPPERLGEAIALFGASNVLMNAVATWTAEVVAESHGWTPAFMGAGAAGVLSTVLALFIREERAERSAQPVADLPPPLRTRLTRDALIMAMAGGAFATLFIYYQPFALQLGITELRAFFIGFTASVLTTRTLLGRLPDRLGRGRTVSASLALYVAVLWVMPALVPGTLLYYGAAFGLAHGFFYPAMNALAIEDVPPNTRGRVMTAINGGFQAGYTVCVLGLGYVASAAGFTPVFVLGGVLALAGLGLSLTRRPPAGEHTTAGTAGSRA